MILLPAGAFSDAKVAVHRIIHKCHVVNSNFNGTINEIHHMEFATGKENNETYTFNEMLKLPDAKD